MRRRSLIPTLLLLLLSACVTPDVTQERLARHYESVAFERVNEVFKLSGIVDYRVTYDRLKDYNRWEPLLREHLDNLGKHAEVTFRRDDDSPVMTVWVDLANSEHSDTMKRSHVCTTRFVEIGDDKRTIVKMVVATQQSALVIKRCIPHEVGHVLLLMGHSHQITPSIFFPSGDYLGIDEAPWYDIAVLRIYADDRIQNGMTREQAMPMVRQIIAEKWQEFQQ